MEIEVPRDRSGSFEPLLIAKGQKRFEGFDEKIIAMYARGMTVCEIAGFLLDHYKVEVSADFISTVTDAVLEEVAEWQNRPLEACYPLVFFDAIRVKIRDEGFVRNKAVYIALGILADGTKAILGMWIEQTEGAKFWLRVMNELKNRGVERHPDRRGRRAEGLPRGDHRRVPRHGRADLHRASDPSLAAFVSWKDRKPVMPALRAIYRAADAEAGRQAPGGVRSRPLGPEVSGHRHELATQLGARGAVLRLPRRRPADHLHHQRD